MPLSGIAQVVEVSFVTERYSTRQWRRELSTHIVYEMRNWAKALETQASSAISTVRPSQAISIPGGKRLWACSWLVSWERWTR